jgi:hypothetical protein
MRRHCVPAINHLRTNQNQKTSNFQQNSIADPSRADNPLEELL